MGPKWIHKYPYKREVEGNVSGRGGNETTEAGIRVRQPQATECWQFSEAEWNVEWILF